MTRRARAHSRAGRRRERATGRARGGPARAFAWMSSCSRAAIGLTGGHRCGTESRFVRAQQYPRQRLVAVLVRMASRDPDPMQSYLLVFLGAGIGGALRHGVNVGCARACGTAFPWATLAVNVVGSL